MTLTFEGPENPRPSGKPHTTCWIGEIHQKSAPPSRSEVESSHLRRVLFLRRRESALVEDFFVIENLRNSPPVKTIKNGGHSHRRLGRRLVYHASTSTASEPTLAIPVDPVRGRQGGGEG